MKHSQRPGIIWNTCKGRCKTPGDSSLHSLASLGCSSRNDILFVVRVGEQAGAQSAPACSPHEISMRLVHSEIGDQYVMRLLEASLLNDNRKCGVIDPKGATSFFFFRKGNKILIFRISATHGFEFFGEK